MTNDNDTQQTKPLLDKNGKFAKGNTPPAGFNVNPQNQSPGGWKPENTISYQYRRFLHMTPEELKKFAETPDKDRTVAMDIAYSQVIASRKSLPHTKEITDRTEGKPPQAIDITTDGEKINGVYSPELAAEYSAFLKSKTKQ